MADTPLVFDRKAARTRRARVASLFPRADFLHRHAAEDLAERLGAVSRDFPLALDLGSGEGVLSEALLAGGRIGWLVRLDPRPGFPVGALSVAGDEEALPFAEGAFDLVASCLSLHAVNDLPGTLAQIRRILKPDGLFLAVLFGADTLCELREAFLVAESEAGGASPRVAPFADLRDLGALLQRAGFALPVADQDRVTVRYADPLALMRDLRSMGAANALADRSRAFLRRGVLARALEVYGEKFADPDGRIRATFNLTSLSGWAPHESQQRPLRPGSARRRLADALGAEERPAGEKAG